MMIRGPPAALNLCATIPQEAEMTAILADTTPATEVEPLTIADRTFRSRLFLGTGKYPDFQTMAAALEASGTEVVTVALRRGNPGGRGQGRRLDFLDPE